MKLAAILCWVLGAGLVLGLVAFQGPGAVLSAVAQVGLWGLVAICASYPLEMVVNNICWRMLTPAPARVPLARLFWPHWVCDAVNWLLPAAQVGGDVVRAQILTRLGAGRLDAAAGVVADITAGILSEALFALIGLVLLLAGGASGNTLAAALVGAVLLVAFTALFFLAQRAGLFRRAAGLLRRMLSPETFDSVVGSAEALDVALGAIYADHQRLLVATLWRLAGWFIGAAPVWIGLHFMGHPTSLAGAIILESLGQAVRHAAFFIPGGLGVQEAGFMLLGHGLGLTPDAALALSLLKRAREVSMGLPALVLWYAAESRRLLRRKRA